MNNRLVKAIQYNHGCYFITPPAIYTIRTEHSRLTSSERPEMQLSTLTKIEADAVIKEDAALVEAARRDPALSPSLSPLCNPVTVTV